MKTEPDRGVVEPGLDHPEPPRRVDSLAPFQRLVVNPFLVLLAWLAAFLLVRHGVHVRRLPWFLVGLGLGLGAPLLLQCHCLDCGATLWLPRRMRHACRGVSARVVAGQTRPFLFPSLIVQVVFWAAAITLATGTLWLRRFSG